MVKIDAENFLYTTGRIRSLERELLGRERISRMIDAKLDEDALKVLYDCGYQEALSGTADLESALSRFRLDLYNTLSKFVPEPAVLDIFRLKYDFHNIKTAVKSGNNDENLSRLYIEAGTVPLKELLASVPDGENKTVPDEINEAIRSASEILARTRDPQLVDFELDRAMFKCQADRARGIGSEFLLGLIKLMADISNLRSAVRARRMGRGRDLLRFALLDEGNIPAGKIIDAETADLPSIFNGVLAPAAKAAASSEPMSEIDLICDNLVIEYLQDAKLITYGEQPLAAYIYAREYEITQIRIIMAGRAAGLHGDAIRAGLRRTYV